MKIYLGKNIKYLREKRKLDQQELADILSVPRSTLACWENNLRNPYIFFMLFAIISFIILNPNLLVDYKEAH